ncbi:hypothetical protein [Arthrobacter sp. H20]|uniref:hypothetical protein n=1 Tax=Arthrobacter sp. H20 TaxID=1267981 RepID=UPI00047CE88B|nr:hypothetical protein [Arthrobacter sp. H20]
MDVSRAPTGERQRNAILEAIRQDGDVREKHFLEVKSSFDLNLKEDCAKVAKFILGAANRPVDLAARAFGGYAVMVLGAEKGRVGGVPAGLEILALGQKIGRYFGTSGPQWDLERRPADGPGTEALFILIEPPRQGDPVYVCRKDFTGSNASSTLRDGDVYVRGQGETRKVDSADLDRLFARARQRTVTVPEFEVSLDSPAHLILPSDGVRQRIVENAIEQAREKYVKVQSAPFPNATVAALAISNPMFGGTEWTSERFDKRAEEWEDELTDNWSSILDKLAGAVLPGPRFSVHNTQSQFLEAVRVDIFLENVRGVDHTNVEDLDKNKLIPPVVRSRNPYGMDLFEPIDYSGLRAANSTYPLSWDNELDGLRVIIELPHLRPSTPWVSEDDDLVLLATSESVRAHWRVTALGYNHAFEADLAVQVSEPHDFRSLMRMTTS